MEEEHIPTIIRLILLMDLVLIQLKDSLLIFYFPNNSPQWTEIQGIDTQRDWLYSEKYFRKVTASAYVN